MSRTLSESIANDIRFTEDESKAINLFVRMVESRIISTYELNEGIMDKAKDVMSKIKSLPEKLRKAYIFCEGILKKGITKVSEFVQFLVELFGKISDTLRGAVIALGGFDKTETTKESDGKDVFGGTITSDDEKLFLKYVIEYVNGRRDNNAFLNEDVLGDIETKVSNNKFLSSIICGTYDGKQVGFWKSLMISVVGCLVINIGVGILCTAIGFATAVSPITAIVMTFWQCRGIMKAILSRKKELKDGNKDEKFFNRALVINILISVGVLALFSVPCVKEFLGKIVSDSMEWSGDQLKSFLDNCNGRDVTEISSAMTKLGTTTATVYSKMITTQCVNNSKNAIQQVAKNVAKTGAISISAMIKQGVNLPKDTECFIFKTNLDIKKLADKAINDAIKKLGGKAITFNDVDKGLCGVLVPSGADVKGLETAIENVVDKNNAKIECGILGESLRYKMARIIKESLAR